MEVDHGRLPDPLRAYEQIQHLSPSVTKNCTKMFLVTARQIAICHESCTILKIIVPRHQSDSRIR